MDPATKLVLYKVFHFAGLFGLFTTLGALITSGNVGDLKKSAMIIHGVSWFLVLLGGFGMLAVLKLDLMQPWFFIKFTILLALGAAPVLAKKGILRGSVGWLILIIVGVIAAYVATTIIPGV